MAKNEEKRMADTYEIESAFYINGKEVVFGVDDKSDMRYLVAYCSSDNPFGIAEYHNCIGTNVYAEAMQEFGKRINEEAEKSMARRFERGEMPTFTEKDVIPESRHGNFEGQLIVIRPEILQRDKQTADYQLCRAVGGFGCRANARGRAVYARTVYDNREIRYDREDVLGVIKPERIPNWAKERISARKQIKDYQQPER